MHLGGLDQHHLDIAQVVQVIELILQEMAHFLEARMRVDGAHDIEHGQQPPRRHPQVMDGFLREFLAAGLELSPVFVPTLVERCRQGVFNFRGPLFLIHDFKLYAEYFFEEHTAFFQRPFLKHQVAPALQAQLPAFFLFRQGGVCDMARMAHIHAVRQPDQGRQFAVP